MFASFASDFQTFLSTPFHANMDLFSVFLAVGLIMVLIVLWSRIIAHLADI